MRPKMILFKETFETENLNFVLLIGGCGLEIEKGRMLCRQMHGYETEEAKIDVTFFCLFVRIEVNVYLI